MNENQKPKYLWIKDILISKINQETFIEIEFSYYDSISRCMDYRQYNIRLKDLQLRDLMFTMNKKEELIKTQDKLLSELEKLIGGVKNEK